MSPGGHFITTITALYGVTVVVSGLLPSPRNVRLTSKNMDLVLRWDPPENVTGEVLYTTEYRVILLDSSSKPACVNTSALFCDLTDPHLQLNIMEFGQYSASVQARSGEEESQWVHSQNLTLDKDTVIGPPDVVLVSSGVNLELSVTDPQFKVSTRSRVFSLVHYNISYWPQRRQHMLSHLLVQQDRIVLSDLEPWTEYCVKVQVQVDSVRNHNHATPSDPVCESTADKESAPWLAAVLTFFALAIAVALVVSAVVYHKRIGDFFCPKDTLPQFLLGPSHSPLTLTSQEEVYHQGTLIPDNCPGEEHHLEDEHSHCTKEHTSTEQS